MFVYLLVLGVSPTLALDNGLALTPPMGWLTWAGFGCVTDCANKPDKCISENLIKRTADLMVSEGFLEVGYNYIGIDDCWMEMNRTDDGKLQANKKRFPSGMKSLADYVHSKGLKFGLYEDYGNFTCQHYPGVMGHEQADVDTLAGWEVDYIKLDGCYSNKIERNTGYPDFGKRLNASGRPILYSCSWPAYSYQSELGGPIRSRGPGHVPIVLSGEEGPDLKFTSWVTRSGPLPGVDLAVVAKDCNLWRIYEDIEPNWDSVSSILDWFGDHQDRMQPHAGPGHWNDPDMLVIGSKYVLEDLAQVQMAVWAVLAAPLLMSTDLATLTPGSKATLLNKDVIAVNQDPLGIQGRRITVKGPIRVWTRELSNNCYAVAFVNYNQNSTAADSFSFQEMGVPARTYTVQDLFKSSSEQINPKDDFKTSINPGGVAFFKFTPKKDPTGDRH